MSTTNVTLLSQALQVIPRSIVDAQIKKFKSDKHAKCYSTWNQFIAMMLCHLGDLSSVRDVSNALHVAKGDLNHLGVRAAPSKSSISYQNQHRNAAVFEGIYKAVLEHLEPCLHKRKAKLSKLKRQIFALDSTVISSNAICIRLGALQA